MRCPIQSTKFTAYFHLEIKPFVQAKKNMKPLWNWTRIPFNFSTGIRIDLTSEINFLCPVTRDHDSYRIWPRLVYVWPALRRKQAAANESKHTSATVPDHLISQFRKATKTLPSTIEILSDHLYGQTVIDDDDYLRPKWFRKILIPRHILHSKSNLFSPFAKNLFQWWLLRPALNKLQRVNNIPPSK